jgi:hypothetical protein
MKAYIIITNSDIAKYVNLAIRKNANLIFNIDEALEFAIDCLETWSYSNAYIVEVDLNDYQVDVEFFRNSVSFSSSKNDILFAENEYFRDCIEANIFCKVINVLKVGKE